MSQTIGIILRFREDAAEAFEAMFEREVLPLWNEFAREGKFLSASLTPVEGGGETKEAMRDYILHVEVPGMGEHEEFDEHPLFNIAPGQDVTIVRVNAKGERVLQRKRYAAS